MSFCRLLPVLAAGAASAAWAEPACGPSTPVGAACLIALTALHPTQPTVGMMEVEERAARMRRDIDFIAATRKHPIPVVHAPDGGFYLIDGHHFVSALNHIGTPAVIARMIGSFADPATFWQQMQARHWVYLFDAKGHPIPPSALPKRIADMADDPYRSLASYAENAGYFKHTDTYFMEFEWARYFGSHMGWRPIDRLHLLDALETAERLACLPEAHDLPGYTGPCRDTH